MTTNYPVVFEQEDNGAISGYVPGLPVYVAADTRARAERAMRELLESYFAEHGGRAPRATTQIKVARVEQGTGTTRVVLVGSGALLGQRTSAAKAAAARANGAKGGRPRLTSAAGARHK